jgi:hypothetical protein
MKTLTKKQFDLLPAGGIFANGILPNSPDGLNMINDHQGRELHWIAVKGWENDWAIYCHWAEHDVEYIQEQGDKVTMESNIKRCVYCDDEVFKLYRY